MNPMKKLVLTLAVFLTSSVAHAESESSAQGDRRGRDVAESLRDGAAVAEGRLELGHGLGRGPGADEFLGTQGDPWDTQSDMLCAVIGALVVLALSKVHDRQVARFARATVSAAVH